MNFEEFASDRELIPSSAAFKLARNAWDSAMAAQRELESIDRLLLAIREARRAHMTSLNHVVVLAYLSKTDGGELPCRLAKVANVSTAAITGIVEVLAKLELVERLHSDDDRRERRVVITAKGLETIFRMLP